MSHMPPNLHEFPFSVQMPIQMTLREHHCLPPHLPVPCGGDGHGKDGDGFRNAYFPPGTEFLERHVRSLYLLLSHVVLHYYSLRER